MVAGRTGLGADGAGRLTRPRTLVVLGGGPAQRHAIDAARALGVRTIVCDADPRFADVPVSSEDIEGILRTARDADGLIAPGTDWPVRIAAAVAEELHIPHPIPAAVAIICTDKIAQRTRLDAAGVPQPRWSTDAPPAYPCVVKAADRQGQRAMTIVRDPDGLDEATERARHGSRGGRVIYEEFVPGPEVTVNAFSIDGRFLPVTVTDRIHFEGVPGVARRHVYPAAAAGAGAAAAVAEAAVAAVGITSGPSYVQLILADDGPCVVEVAARLGGGHDSEICRTAVGVDLAAAAVLAALGQPVDPEALQTHQNGAAVIEFLAAPPGELVAATGPAEVCFYDPRGHVYGPLRIATDRAGYVLATGSDRAGALRKAANAVDSVRFEVR
jgi:biotin carboxylase